MSGTVDVQVVDPTGAVVMHNLYGSQTFNAGQTHTYATTFQVPMSAHSGTYVIKLQIMDSSTGAVIGGNATAGSYQV